MYKKMRRVLGKGMHWSKGEATCVSTWRMSSQSEKPQKKCQWGASSRRETISARKTQHARVAEGGRKTKKQLPWYNEKQSSDVCKILPLRDSSLAKTTREYGWSLHILIWARKNISSLSLLCFEFVFSSAASSLLVICFHLAHFCFHSRTWSLTQHS